MPEHIHTYSVSYNFYYSIISNFDEVMPY